MGGRRSGVLIRTGELRPIWRFFGAGEPNYAYMKHGKKPPGELGELGEDAGDNEREGDGAI